MAIARRLKPSRATAVSARQSLPCYTAVARLGSKRRATAVLKSNLIRSILARQGQWHAQFSSYHMIIVACV